MLREIDEQWALIRKHFPEEHIPDDCPGSKPISAQKVLDAVLWILNTGAQCHMLPHVLAELQNRSPSVSAVVREPRADNGSELPYPLLERRHDRCRRAWPRPGASGRGRAAVGGEGPQVIFTRLTAPMGNDLPASKVP